MKTGKQILLILCIFLVSFQIEEPSQTAYFGLWSDTESLTDLQLSSLSQLIRQSLEMEGQMILIEEKSGVTMPASLAEVKAGIYEVLRQKEIRYGIFGWLEAGKEKSLLRILILDARTEEEAEGSAAYRFRSDIYTAVIPAVENLIKILEKKEGLVVESDYIPRNWIRIPGGFFKMGENYHRSDNQPQHEVRLDDYWMDPYEVTVDEFREFVADTGYYMGQGAFIHDGQMRMVFEKDLNYENPGYEVTGHMPVSCVSWIDALHYCNWKSQKRGLTPCYEIDEKGVRWNRQADGYRLPTEAEWEYAASGGQLQRQWIFSGSDNIGSVAVHAANSGGSPATVGSLKPNRLGLYDMSGNVFEWCWDIYGENYYSELSPGDNPTGPQTGAFRVYRGGSWHSPPLVCLVFNRLSNNPQLRSNLVGFRLARSGEDAGFDISR